MATIQAPQTVSAAQGARQQAVPAGLRAHAGRRAVFVQARANGFTGAAVAGRAACVAGRAAGRRTTQVVYAVKDGAALDRPLRVAIIGGGPSGACAAETLAKGGVEAFLIERKLDNCKAGGHRPDHAAQRAHGRGNCATARRQRDRHALQARTAAAATSRRRGHTGGAAARRRIAPAAVLGGAGGLGQPAQHRAAGRRSQQRAAAAAANLSRAQPCPPPDRAAPRCSLRAAVRWRHPAVHGAGV